MESKLIRAKKRTIDLLREEFPDLSTDSERVDVLLTRTRQLRVLEESVNRAGRLFYGGGLWSKLNKKRVKDEKKELF